MAVHTRRAYKPAALVTMLVTALEVERQAENKTDWRMFGSEVCSLYRRARAPRLSSVGCISVRELALFKVFDVGPEPGF